eukprot:966288-Pelagomonas_calceolata.AAC.3
MKNLSLTPDACQRGVTMGKVCCLCVFETTLTKSLGEDASICVWWRGKKRGLNVEVQEKGQLASIMRPGHAEYQRHHMSVTCTIQWLGEGLEFFCPRPKPGSFILPHCNHWNPRTRVFEVQLQELPRNGDPPLDAYPLIRGAKP